MTDAQAIDALSCQNEMAGRGLTVLGAKKTASPPREPCSAICRRNLNEFGKLSGRERSLHELEIDGVLHDRVDPGYAIRRHGCLWHEFVANANGEALRHLRVLRVNLDPHGIVIEPFVSLAIGSDKAVHRIAPLCQGAGIDDMHANRLISC